MESDITISRVVKLALRALQELNYFKCNAVISGWHLKWDNETLSKKGYKAATTAIGNEPVLYLSDTFYLENDIQTLIHEVIHMAQIIKGDYIPGFGDGKSIWKGKEYKNLPFDDPNYFSNQPWEKEANDISTNVLIKMAELRNKE